MTPCDISIAAVAAVSIGLSLIFFFLCNLKRSRTVRAANGRGTDSLSELNSLETILSLVNEALLVVGQSGEIISINDAAARMLGAKARGAGKRLLGELNDESDPGDFVKEIFASPARAVRRKLADAGGRRVLDAMGSALADAGGAKSALIVLHDVTEMEKQEVARREFVANVTHELKTPITAIKGSIETLEDGAIDDPENARRFVEILSRHANRLGDIIDGLLTLSTIEQDTGGGEVALTRQPMKPILESAVHACAQRAAARNVSIELECDDVEIAANGLLLDRAIANLIDNAIKYSGTAEPIRVRCRANAGEILVSVKDSGAGIPDEHLPRIFERFYRVDKARSRAMGGTGLGLAIVKRIAEAHGGRVEARSDRGQGSTFTIHLPIEATEKASALDRLTIVSQRYYRNLIESIYLFDSDLK